MKDLNQLKENILQEVHDEQLKQYAVVSKEEEERINVANANFSKQEMERKTALKKVYKNQLEREQQSLLNQSKKEILQVKHELLSNIYNGAIAVMSSWSGDTLVMFIQQALQQLNLTGDYELIFGEQTQANISEHDRYVLSEQFSNMTISHEIIAKQAGFVVKQNGIEYSYLFEQLVEDMKNDFSPVLAKIAFEQ